MEGPHVESAGRSRHHLPLAAPSLNPTHAALVGSLTAASTHHPAPKPLLLAQVRYPAYTAKDLEGYLRVIRTSHQQVGVCFQGLAGEAAHASQRMWAGVGCGGATSLASVGLIVLVAWALRHGVGKACG